jgi:2,3-bisphosphoglycerate-independent phosphoglycerate mutase
MTAKSHTFERPKPVVLCILDGWGHRPESQANAIAMANTPNYSRMLRECPHALVHTSGSAVGLSDGQMGNSEVGHMNIGAGRIVLQDLPRIDKAVADGGLASNPELVEFIRNAKTGTGTVHLMGLLSPGGVHSHQDHIAALARILDRQGLNVWIHAFLDGRDTPPKSALGFAESFLETISDLHQTKMATIGGRYFGMDRDNRWDRVAMAYAAIICAEGGIASSALAAIEGAYARGVTDEFIEPVILGDYRGVNDGDAILMANFRADRVRQILTAILDRDFARFTRPKAPVLSATAGLTEYSDWLTQRLLTLYPGESVQQSLGEVVSSAGFRQLRLAETEKYPHVTYFFNGGRESVFPGEDRILVPSPKVATYDLQPEMSAPEVTKRLLTAIASNAYDLIVVNYANPDMVGHTGDLQAAIKAVETIDAFLGQIWSALALAGGVMILTADHGNVEMMADPLTSEPHTAHTTLDVPVVLINAGMLGSPVRLKNGGRLADIAPTILQLLRLPQPPEMTGNSLLENDDLKSPNTIGEALETKS